MAFFSPLAVPSFFFFFFCTLLCCLFVCMYVFGFVSLYSFVFARGIRIYVCEDSNEEMKQFLAVYVRGL